MNGDARNGSGAHATGSVKLLPQSALSSWRLGAIHRRPLACEVASEVAILVCQCPQIGSADNSPG